MLFVFILIFLCSAIVTMAIVAKRNDKEQTKRLIAEYRRSQRHNRIEGWKRRAIEWKMERKKPVKVQFT